MKTSSRQPYKPRSIPKASAPAGINHPTSSAVFNNYESFQYYFIAFLALLLYANTLTCKFTLDDSMLITNNSFTKKGISGIKDIMTNEWSMGFYGVKKKLVAGGRYRPLSQIFFAVEYQLFGMKPFPGHLCNVLFYVFLCVFLFYLLKKLLPDYHSPTWYRSLPFLVAVIFTAHPLHTEIVANIKGFDEILALSLTLPAILFILKYIETRKFFWLSLTFILFTLALLSRESQITFLAVIPLCLFFFRKVQVKDYFITLIPIFCAFGIYLIARYLALGYLNTDVTASELLNNPYLNATFSEQSATNIYTWGKYLQLLFIPHPLTHDYYPKQIELISWPNLKAVFSLLIYAGLAFISLYYFARKHIISFAILLFFVTFSISSNVVFNLGTFMNERFMFFPLTGFAFCLAYFTQTSLRKWMHNEVSYRKLMFIIWALLLGLYSLKTVSRNLTWKDDFTLFTTDVQTSMNSAKCNVSAGLVYLEKAYQEKDSVLKARELETAEHFFSRGLEIHPKYAAAWILMGNVYLQRKIFPKARDYYINGLNIYNTQPEANANLAYVADQMKSNYDFPNALIAYQALLRFQPDNQKHLIQIADLYSRMNKADTAVVILNRILEKDPNNAAAYSKLGEIFGRVYKNLPKSEEYLLKAYRIDPKNAAILENLGLINALKENFSLALEFYFKALVTDSINPGVLSNIGIIYGMMGDKVKAQEFFTKSQDAARKEKN